MSDAARLEAALALLRRHQWAAKENGNFCCPECGHRDPIYDVVLPRDMRPAAVGHEPECRILKVLGEKA